MEEKHSTLPDRFTRFSTGFRWVRADDSGHPSFQVFTIQTYNRHNRSDIVATGSFTLSAVDGRIYNVEYSCQGYPNGGYAPSVQLGGDGRSFTWFRKWDGDPAIESYKADYEVEKRICVKNCQ
jgi:hypothetical protein